MKNLAQFSQSPRVELDALLDSTVSICIEQLAQVLDLAADLGSGIGVAHHAATVCLVKTVGLALDVHVACECLGNRRKGPVRLEAAAARARDERIAGDTRLGMVSAAEAAIEAAKSTKTVPMHTFSGPVEHAIAHIEEAAVHSMPEEQQRWYAIKIFERDDKVLDALRGTGGTVLQSSLSHEDEAKLQAALNSARAAQKDAE